MATALEFWYDRLGRYLHHEDFVGTNEEAAIHALSRTHVNPNFDEKGVPKKPMRIGGGGDSLSVVTQKYAYIYDAISASRPLPTTAEVRPLTADGGQNAVLIRLMLDPPEPPFLIVRHGKSANKPHTWRMNTHRDAFEISGVGSLSVHLPSVRAALPFIKGIPDAKWKLAAKIIGRLQRGGDDIATLKAQLTVLEKKTEGLTVALDYLPSFGSDNFYALDLLARAKD